MRYRNTTGEVLTVRLGRMRYPVPPFGTVDIPDEYETKMVLSHAPQLVLQVEEPAAEAEPVKEVPKKKAKK
jgi:hypothetical protein